MLLWHRGPVIWNFFNKTAQFPESLASFKNTIRKLHADLEAFSFNKETVDNYQEINDFIIFWLAEYYSFTRNKIPFNIIYVCIFGSSI